MEWTRALKEYQITDNKIEFITEPHTDLWQRKRADEKQIVSPQNSHRSKQRKSLENLAFPRLF